MDTLIDVAPFAWPLVVALVLLYLLHKVSNEVQPIVVNVVNGLAKQASSNALGYGLAIGYGLSASLQAAAEQATALHWLILAAACKVVNPFIVAMLAYAAKNSFSPTSALNTPAPAAPAPSPAPQPATPAST
jgi:histidine ammonia-lyase